MSSQKVAKLAEEFQIKLAEQQYENQAPPDKKASDFSPEEASFIRSLSKKDNNELDENSAEIDEKTWKKAKKAVKKYWKKYDEPWAVVYHVYKNMGGGKPGKKKKKKSGLDLDAMFAKYGEYLGGPIPNTLPPQNNVSKPDYKKIATHAVYSLVNALHSENQHQKLGNHPKLDHVYAKLMEFYQSLLEPQARAKFDVFNSVKDDLSFMLSAEGAKAEQAGHKQRGDRKLLAKNETLTRVWNAATTAVANLEQEVYGSAEG